MEKFLDSLVTDDYVITHKIVLAFLILAGTFLLKFLNNREFKFRRVDNNLLGLYIIFFILFAGTRANHIGVDTNNYYFFFFIPAVQASNYIEIFSILNTDFLFEVLMSLTVWTNSFTLYKLSVALVMNTTFYVFVRRYTNYGKKGSGLVLFMLLACTFTFLNLQLNIVRNGLAIGFILMAIHYALDKNIKKCILFFIIGYLFHRTTIIPFVLVLATLFDRDLHIKYYLMFYGLTIGLSLVGFGFHSVDFLTSMGNEDLQGLKFEGETTYRIGFRPDFVAYNTFFLALFLKFGNLKSRETAILIKYYILSSAVFFLNFYIPFSDRFGVYSWIVLPLLMFNVINDYFPKSKMQVSTIVLISFFVLNYVILFP